jgi:hypothetical protein
MWTFFEFCFTFTIKRFYTSKNTFLYLTISTDKSTNKLFACRHFNLVITLWYFYEVTYYKNKSEKYINKLNKTLPCPFTKLTVSPKLPAGQQSELPDHTSRHRYIRRSYRSRRTRFEYKMRC